MTNHRLGIDVGGTNTDAVVLTDTGEPLTSTKTNTSPDITTGILTAFDEVLSESKASPDDIDQVMLGTTHCTNAIAERTGLSEVGVIRLGDPATTSVPPLTTWPDDLIEEIGDNVAILSGGHEYDGQQISNLDETSIRSTVRDFSHVDAFAVSSVFSPVQNEHERRVKSIIQEIVAEDISISLSHDVGNLGLIERENANILNAALTNVAEQAADSFLAAMQQRDVDATLYFARNDGTLMNTLQATSKPVFMIASGPANSIRGAAHLSGIQNGIVIDVGGTTTDVGVIRGGFPRKSAASTDIGGVDANFHLPDIVSLPIGGGSVVRTDNDRVQVGPRSVGHKLTKASKVFGGDTLTTTDVKVAAGSVSIGDASVNVDEDVIQEVRDQIRQQITDAVIELRTSSEPVPAVVVGGGSFLVPTDIEGISKIHRPEYYDIANAVGVATAQVSAQSDRLYDLETQSRNDALKLAKQRAFDHAISNGADESTLSVLSIDEVPISYLSKDVVRIKVNVAGDLNGSSQVMAESKRE